MDQEARIQQAVEAIRNNQVSSVRQAAILYSVPRSTLQGRLSGTRSHAEAKEPLQRFSAAEEDSIAKAVLQMQLWGWSLTIESLENFAGRILKNKNDPVPLGGNWHKNFKTRHPEIKLKKARHPDQQRKDGATHDVLSSWFETYQRVVLTYAIVNEDIYNTEEKGITKDISDTAKAFISRSDKDAITKNPASGEWASVIECIGLNGYIPPPFIVFSGERVQDNWLDPAINQDTVIRVSQNGWSDHDITLAWLRHFDEKTRDQRRGLYRLLILDGHSSHECVEFVQYCEQHQIVPLCLPPHTSHVLQPLDVGVFGLLGAAYKQLISERAVDSALRIDNRQLLLSYQDARQCIARSIPGAWKAVGLFPYSPSNVLSVYRPKTPAFISVTNQDGQRVDFPIDSNVATMINNFVEQILEHYKS